MNIPFYSQRVDKFNYEQEGFSSLKEACYWSNRMCGLACLKMVLAAKQNKVIPLCLLRDQALSLSGYLKDIGWIHQSLADVAKQFYNLDAQCHSIGSVLSVIDQAIENNCLIMASVSCGVIEKTRGGHLVLITHINKNNYVIHHPSSKKNEEWADYTVSKNRFLAAFSQQGNIIIFS